MFTTIMYGFINEVTRQPGNAGIAVTGNPGGETGQSDSRPRRRTRRNPRANPRQLAGTYHVLADSFRRAAGFLS